MKVTKQLNKWLVRTSYGLGMATVVWPAMAFAAVGGGTMPWDPTLATLQADMQGPVAHTITTAAVIGTGVVWGVSEHGPGTRKAPGWAFRGGLALTRPVFLTP